MTRLMSKSLRSASFDLEPSQPNTVTSGFKWSSSSSWCLWTVLRLMASEHMWIVCIDMMTYWYFISLARHVSCINGKLLRTNHRALWNTFQCMYVRLYYSRSYRRDAIELSLAVGNKLQVVLHCLNQIIVKSQRQENKELHHTTDASWLSA